VTDLLDLALLAHGGLDRWQRATTIHARAAVGGLALARRGQGEIFADTDVTLDVHRQHAVFRNFTGPGLVGVYTPGRVSIEDAHGTVLQELRRPRDAFTDLDRTSAWGQLHALYFGGYALWNYLTVPYLLTLPGIQAEEAQPWDEAGERWRRLHVTFPADIATHSSEQTFYFDESGLQRRHDYRVEIGKAPAVTAHYTEAHRTVSGLVFATHRYAVPTAEDNTSLPGPIFISIDIADITVS